MNIARSSPQEIVIDDEICLDDTTRPPTRVLAIRQTRDSSETLYYEFWVELKDKTTAVERCRYDRMIWRIIKKICMTVSPAAIEHGDYMATTNHSTRDATVYKRVRKHGDLVPILFNDGTYILVSTLARCEVIKP